jgi:RNA polymerase sigma-70 factor, ECF subfamily
LRSPIPPSDAQDLELVRRCQEGEREVFAQLIERHKERIFLHVYRWVGQREKAEEILQEVFLKAFAELKRFRKEAKFSTWLFQIALNRCRDFWRSQKRYQGKDLSLEEMNPHLGIEPRVDAELEKQQEVALLRRALATLPAIYREVLSLRYLSELSFEEISQTIGEGLSNVKMRVARGLVQLRKKLEEGKRDE